MYINHRASHKWWNHSLSVGPWVVCFRSSWLQTQGKGSNLPSNPITLRFFQEVEGTIIKNICLALGLTTTIPVRGGAGAEPGWCLAPGRLRIMITRGSQGNGACEHCFQAGTRNGSLQGLGPTGSHQWCGSLDSMTGQSSLISLQNLKLPISPSAGNKGNLRTSLGASLWRKSPYTRTIWLSISKYVRLILCAHLEPHVGGQGAG